jgi:hypothetical protein
MTAPLSAERARGKLISCLLIPREGDEGPMFYQRKDETVVTNLEGYAILPLRDYRKLCVKVGDDPTPSFSAELKRYCG